MRILWFVLGGFLSALSGAWALTRMALDAYGRVDAARQLTASDGAAVQVFAWLMQTPGWMPAFLAAAVVTAWIAGGWWLFVRNRTGRPGQSKSIGGAAEWAEHAHLTIAFDAELQTATPVRQEDVRFYYWYHVPSVGIDFENRQVQPGVGHVMVFMALRDPTHTNYSRVKALGGGVHCEVLSAHPTGAVVRATGDMRGRTLDVRFGKEPMPLG